MMTKVLCDNSPMVEFLISTWLVLVMAAVRLSCNWTQNYFFLPPNNPSSLFWVSVLLFVASFLVAVILIPFFLFKVSLLK